MIVLELIIVLLAIFLGARLGGIGIGFAGGLGVLVLAAIGVKPGNIPFDVISIIMAVIAAISAMQIAGGLDYLVHQTEKLLRKNPKYITILAPIVTYFLTIFAGTGNISLATLPVIAEVAKEQGIKPCRPLSTAVVSAQIAITASPISAAVVYMSSVMEGHGISYIHLLSVVIPSTLLAVLVMSFLITALFNSKLSDDPIYRKRLEEGLVELRGERQVEIKAGAKTSVWLFLLGVVLAVLLSGLFPLGTIATVGGVPLEAQNVLRDAALLCLAWLSMRHTSRRCRELNGFTWGPIEEVAQLFFGIFVSMIPAMAILKAGTSGALAPLVELVSRDGQPVNAMYFWLTGILSSFLDNAPTYMVFFNTAGGDAQNLMHQMPETLAAISAGAVFMGACSYIGNAPNFMIKAIAEQRGVPMPGFFGYMGWAWVFLFPLFVLLTLVFFR